MYRRAFLLLCQGRSALNNVQESRLLSVRCSGVVSAPALRATTAFSLREITTTGALCEDKEGNITQPVAEEERDGGKTEKLQLEAKKSKSKAEAETGTKLPSELKEQSCQEAEELKTEPENASVLKTESQEIKNYTNTKKPEVDVQSQDGSVEVLKKQKTESGLEVPQAKSSKEGLLELLGAMKVEVTTKRKLKVAKTPRGGQEAPPRPGVEEMESTISMFQQAARQAPPHRENLSPELVAAASAAAAAMPDSSRAESELLKQLRKHEAVTDTQRRGEARNIGNIIADMKVGRNPNNRPNARPANQIRFDDDGRGYIHDRGITSELNGVRKRKSGFTGKRLNIFTAAQETETEADLVVGPTLWDVDLANQIAQAVYQRPRNGFEEMIQWTKEGKLWEYPINNELGMDEEAKVPFHDHVFLERHLEDGFPKKGPIRHFMELVVTGLSKNHSLTVQQKLEHIAWFREYFKQKEDVIKEAEAFLS